MKSGFWRKNASFAAHTCYFDYTNNDFRGPMMNQVAPVSDRHDSRAKPKRLGATLGPPKRLNTT